jgi:peptide-methionine (S)-S-oxide reductase
LGSLRGVASTRVGYTGGATPDPTYDTVCAGDGHTEAIKMDFEPTVIPYQRLLSIFFKEHSPTRPSKVQYRSAIFYHSEEQRATAETMKTEFERRRGMCTTAVDPAGEWYDAEEYHQQFLKKRSM